MDKSLTNTFGVYQILNSINGKYYIGSTTQSFRHRWASWRNDLRNNRIKNKHLLNAWNKYGEENFEFSILEIVQDKEKVLEREQYWIDTLQACNPNLGYNMCPKAGNVLGRTHSKETIEKIRAGNIGKKHSESAKEKIRLANIGRAVSEERKAALKENWLGLNNPTRGKSLSVEHKQKLRENHKGMSNKTHSEETRNKLSISASNMTLEHREKLRQGKIKSAKPHPCPICGEPRKRIYYKDQFKNYAKTCGKESCIAARRNQRKPSL